MKRTTISYTTTTTWGLHLHVHKGLSEYITGWCTFQESTVSNEFCEIYPAVQLPSFLVWRRPAVPNKISHERLILFVHYSRICSYWFPVQYEPANAFAVPWSSIHSRQLDGWSQAQSNDAACGSLALLIILASLADCARRGQARLGELANEVTANKWSGIRAAQLDLGALRAASSSGK